MEKPSKNPGKETDVEFMENAASRKFKSSPLKICAEGKIDDNYFPC